ncbi:MAG TPA: carbon-nitrogen hydrolase family protein [Bacillota bacterium]|nr:carbon-nitrogen hydrolase family protein [Bacillota bacterium]
MKNHWTIALAQTLIQDGDKEANLHNMEEIIKQAHQQAADLLLFPELITTGLASKENISQLAEIREGTTLQRMQEIIRRYPMHVVYSFLESEEDNVFITSCLLDKEGKPQHYYRKTHLFTEENKLFSTGDQLETFTIEGVTFGLLTCYDIEFPEPARTLCLKGAEVLLVNSANMSPYENQHRIFCQARAIENQCYVAYCNRLGENVDYVYRGESVIVDPYGTLLLDLKSEAETLGITSFSLHQQTKQPYRYLTERRPELYSV